MKVRLALIQMEVAFGEPEKNEAHALGLLEEAMKEKPDILVLPEIWNTGFFPKHRLAELSDEQGERTKSSMGGFAKREGVNIVAGSVAVKEGPHIYNRSYVFDRKGTVVTTFDKVHGFSLGHEPEYFRMGDRHSYFQLDGLSCSMAICYDLRFPEFIRREILQGVDLFFLPSAWPLLRRDHWVWLTRARAVENQVYFCAVNQGGWSGKAEYAGESLLFGPWGEEICHGGQDETILYGDIDTDVLQEVRERMQVFRDRRPEFDTIEAPES